MKHVLAVPMRWLLQKATLSGKEIECGARERFLSFAELPALPRARIDESDDADTIVALMDLAALPEDEIQGFGEFAALQPIAKLAACEPPAEPAALEKFIR